MGKYKHEKIRAILEMISEGDSDAFRELYDLFYLKVYRFSGYIIKTEEIKEEVVSDVFFSIWQNRKNLEKIENIEAYLYTITRNRSLYYVNKSIKESTTSIDQLSIGFVENEDNPEEMIITQELREEINKAVNELPERCRLIFLMAKEEGLKYKEISEILSISEKTINAQMVTAIKKLSEALRKYLYLLILIVIVNFFK